MTDKERAGVVRMGGFTPEGEPVGWEFDARGKAELTECRIIQGRIIEIGGWPVAELMAMWREAQDMHRAQQSP